MIAITLLLYFYCFILTYRNVFYCIDFFYWNLYFSGNTNNVTLFYFVILFFVLCGDVNASKNNNSLLFSLKITGVLNIFVGQVESFYCNPQKLFKAQLKPQTPSHTTLKCIVTTLRVRDLQCSTNESSNKRIVLEDLSWNHEFDQTTDCNHAAGNLKIIVPEYNANLDSISLSIQLRDYMSNYFLKPSNSLPWQSRHQV